MSLKICFFPSLHQLKANAMKTDSIKEFVGIIQQFNANLKQHLPALEPEIDAMLSGMSPMVMPNHFHVILHIAPVGAPLVGAPNYVGAPNAMDTGRPQGHAPTGILFIRLSLIRPIYISKINGKTIKRKEH